MNEVLDQLFGDFGLGFEIGVDGFGGLAIVIPDVLV